VLARLRHLDAALDARVRDTVSATGCDVATATRAAVARLPVDALRDECARRAETAIIEKVQKALRGAGLPGLAARGAELETRRQMDAVFDGIVAGYVRGKMMRGDVGVVVAGNVP
jgi:hypothetical protein